MYLEIFLADFAVFCVFLGISRDFAEMPEFRGSATARNIRSPEKMNKYKSYLYRSPLTLHQIHWTVKDLVFTSRIQKHRAYGLVKTAFRFRLRLRRLRSTYDVVTTRWS